MCAARQVSSRWLMAAAIPSAFFGGRASRIRVAIASASQASRTISPLWRDVGRQLAAAPAAILQGCASNLHPFPTSGQHKLASALRPHCPVLAAEGNLAVSERRSAFSCARHARSVCRASIVWARERDVRGGSCDKSKVGDRKAK
jgi:hypothetical protein